MSVKNERESSTTGYLPAYEGNDMISFMLKHGFELASDRYGKIWSMTNVRDTAMIVTTFAVLRAKPSPYTGFYVEMVTAL